jgi:hypothetical protein
MGQPSPLPHRLPVRSILPLLVLLPTLASAAPPRDAASPRGPLTVPSGCAVDEGASRTSLRCGPTDLVVARPARSLDALQAKAYGDLQQDGASAVLLLDTRCGADGKTWPCVKVEGRSATGLVGSVWLMIAEDERGSWQVSCRTRGDSEVDIAPLCEQAMRVFPAG